MLYRLFTFMAGVHNVPSATHLKAAPQDTVRVAFDQNGVIYPSNPDAPPIRQPRIGSNYAFSISHELGRVGYSYGPTDIDESLAFFAKTLNDKAERRSANCLVVLIHGYNNSVKAASANYECIRKKLQALPRLQPVYLEVFWDGLHRGPLTVPAPLLYWFDALTYSNLAGQVGLRSLLNGRPPNLPILFLTHSRGAGVALSCVADPLYDARIQVGEYEAPNFRSAKGVALICLAPAVGNGHPPSRVRSSLPLNSSLGIGFNTRDPALQKSIINERYFGDTSFGTNEIAFQEAVGQVNSSDDWLHRSIYEDYPKHDLMGYLEHEGGQPFLALLGRAAATLGLA